MLKFFRRIRQSLLSENKFRTYLIYAIGEIILVVLGILIALAINNWNEERKEASLEIIILSEISENLGEDIQSLNNDLRLNENGIENIRHIEKAFDLESPLTDTLLLRFGRMLFNPTYTLKKSGYQNLSSIGFQIIAVDSIRKSITNLYETQYSFIKEREEVAKKATYDYLNPRYQEYFKAIGFDSSRSTNTPLKLYYPQNYESLGGDPDFQRLLDYSKEIKYHNLYDLNMVLKAVGKTKNMIDTYLKEKSK